MEQIKDINDTINEIIDSYKLGNNGMPPGAVQGADPRYLQQLASQYNMPQGAVPGAVQQPTYQNPYGPAVQQPTYQNPYGPEVQQPTYQTPYGPTYPPAPPREPTYDPISMFPGLMPPGMTQEELERRYPNQASTLAIPAIDAYELERRYPTPFKGQTYDVEGNPFDIDLVNGRTPPLPPPYYPPVPPREPTYDPASMFSGMPPEAIPGSLPSPTYPSPYGPEVQRPTYPSPYGPEVQRPTYPPAPTREPTYDPASMFGGLSPDLQSALLSVLKSNSQKT